MIGRGARTDRLVSPSWLRSATSKRSADSRTVNCGPVVDAGEEPAAGQRVEPGVGVAPADVDAFTHRAVVVPLDGGAMRGVLRRDAEPRRQERWPHFLQADQADPRHADAVDDFGPKRRRQSGGRNAAGSTR